MHPAGIGTSLCGDLQILYHVRLKKRFNRKPRQSNTTVIQFSSSSPYGEVLRQVRLRGAVSCFSRQGRMKRKTDIPPTQCVFRIIYAIHCMITMILGVYNIFFRFSKEEYGGAKHFS
jgi:hypothetical protein